MIKLQVLYGQPSDPSEFDLYFVEHHLPLAMRSLKRAEKLEMQRVQGTLQGDRALYYLTADVWFASLEDMMAGSEEPRGCRGGSRLRRLRQLRRWGDPARLRGSDLTRSRLTSAAYRVHGSGGPSGGLSRACGAIWP